MTDYKVAFTEHLYPETAVEQGILEKVGASLAIGQCRTEDDVIAIARDADALLTYTFKPISEKIMAACGKVKIILRAGIGVDTVDIPAATRHGIVVTNLPGFCTNEVADLTIAMMQSLLLKLPIAMKQTQSGGWDRGAIKPIYSLNTMTVGIVGFGSIGRQSARRAAAFGMTVLFYDPMVAGDVAIGETTARNVGLDELFGQSDAILLHAPATAETHHLINRQTLAKVKQGAVLVNTARGALVDTDAVVEALRSGRLGGAAFDLIENVPPWSAEHPLLQFENVIVTPYYAWYTENSVAYARRRAAEEIARVLTGRRPLAVVNPDVLANARAGQLKESAQ